MFFLTVGRLRVGGFGYVNCRFFLSFCVEGASSVFFMGWFWWVRQVATVLYCDTSMVFVLTRFPSLALFEFSSMARSLYRFHVRGIFIIGMLEYIKGHWAIHNMTSENVMHQQLHCKYTSSYTVMICTT